MRNELGVSVAYCYLTGEVTAEEHLRAVEHHTGVVQLSTCVGDDLDVMLDVAPGDARSLAAAVVRAADLAEGLR